MSTKDTTNKTSAFDFNFSIDAESQFNIMKNKVKSYIASHSKTELIAYTAAATTVATTLFRKGLLGKTINAVAFALPIISVLKEKKEANKENN